jgi:rsbT antagonist protein RsbS
MSDELSSFGIASYISRDILIIPFQADFYIEVLNALRNKVLTTLHENPNLKGMIVDVSQINIIDLNNMEALEKLCKMAKLLGVMPFLVGIKPNAALALIELGYTDSGLRMALDTEQAIFLIEEALVSEDQLDEDEENELSDGSESDEVISDEEKEPAQDD